MKRPLQIATAGSRSTRKRASATRIEARLVLAVAGLGVAVIVLAGCGSGKSGASKTPGQSASGERHYTLASIESCWFGDGTGEYDPSDRSGPSYEDLDVAVSRPLAQAAYSTGQGAFVTLSFPSSTGHGAAFYGFATAQAAAAAMVKYRHEILTTPVTGFDGYGTRDDPELTPTPSEVWRTGNIIVVGVPAKLPSVEANKLNTCFGGVPRRVPLVPPS